MHRQHSQGAPDGLPPPARIQEVIAGVTQMGLSMSVAKAMTLLQANHNHTKDAIAAAFEIDDDDDDDGGGGGGGGEDEDEDDDGDTVEQVSSREADNVKMDQPQFLSELETEPSQAPAPLVALVSLKRHGVAHEEVSPASRSPQEKRAKLSPPPSSSPDSSARSEGGLLHEERRFASGAAVRLHGLCSNAKANGACGVVVAFDAPLQRYCVKMDGLEKVVKIRAGNLECLDL
jgi:hypothetical protein